MIDHPRDNWPFRRRLDTTLVLTLIGMLATTVVFGIRVVRAHSKWMDKVDEAVALRPEVESLKEQFGELKAVNTTQMSLIIRELDGIHKELARRREALRQSSVPNVAQS